MDWSALVNVLVCRQVRYAVDTYIIPGVTGYPCSETEQTVGAGLRMTYHIRHTP